MCLFHIYIYKDGADYTMYYLAGGEGLRVAMLYGYRAVCRAVTQMGCLTCNGWTMSFWSQVCMHVLY